MSLKDAVYDIAFLSMSQEDLAKHVHLSGLLSADEMVSIYGRLDGMELPCVKWKKRKQKGFERIARFLLSNVKDPNPGPIPMWTYTSEKLDCLSFSVNRKSLFHGVRLFGDRKGSQYKVMLQLNGSELENGSFTSNIDKDGIAGFDVMLSSPVTVEESIIVTISATISGSESCYGENGIAKAESGALAVTFHDYLINELTIIEMTNGTTCSRGQFYEIYISDAES